MNKIYLGLVFKRNDTFIYSKTLILNTENKKLFVAQIIRDVDFGLIVDKNEIINLEIVKYPTFMSYIDANIEGIYHNFKIIGTYDIIFNNLNKDYVFQKRTHGTYNQIIDKNFNLELIFSFKIYGKNKYILSTPILTGKNTYLGLDNITVINNDIII